MPTASTIVWLRNDLRVDDHPALRAAIDRGGPVIPLFIWSPGEESPWQPGAASRVWLHHSLITLNQSLRERGSRLLIARGDDSSAELERIIKASGAAAVLWSRRYEPAVIERDARIEKRLREIGIACESFNAALLHEPRQVRTKAGRPFQVFTPFWNACLAMPEPPEPLAAPRKIPAPRKWPRSLTVDDLDLLPRIAWHVGIRGTWQPGEAGAKAALRKFLSRALNAYQHDRDHPDIEGTSRLSPHLHFGEISPRRIWHALAGATRTGEGGQDRFSGAERFATELGWREFAHHLLQHFPHTSTEPLRQQFRDFPWRRDRKALRAWQRGRTGYPFVDAGMRQLWRTGWMHNRMRMIVASFLVKHLLLPWQDGARWFWDTLVDADLANNTLGWQWTAGCGADAAPYFRIFNPTAQGEKFDPHGDYVRRWVAELAKVPAAFIHKPWEAPPGVLRSAGVVLGETYPRPIVDHRVARERALEALAATKRSGV